LRRYPWAGSLSTAHTLLWYDRCGINIFKQLATQRMWDPTPISLPHSRYKIENMAAHAEAAEQDIWHTLIHEQRTVSPKSYRTMAEHLPLAYPTQPQRARRQRHFPKVR
jgi:phenylalanine-4-hydroxylase